MSAVVDTYRDDTDVSYAVDFGRDREPSQKRSRFPEYRRKGSAPARVSGMHCRRNKRWTWGSGRGARMLNMRAFAGSLVFAVAGAVASLSAAAFGVVIDYTNVANPGNPANVGTGWGAVSSTFKISKYETTNQQYKDFLNAVDSAGTNPNGIYNSLMGSDSLGGITFNAGASAGSKYAVKAGTAPSGASYTNMPVVFTSWWSAARFVNWLENGQGSGGTETGAYTLNNATSGPIVARNAGAKNFLPSRDEWYKSGFYNGSSYTTWQTNSNTQPTNTVTNLTLANAANYGFSSTPTTNPIAVGAYTNTQSAYGLYDMLGNVTEYTDTAGTGADAGRPQLFSGSWAVALADINKWNANAVGVFRNSTSATSQIGFRVAAVPEPATIALAGVGLAGLAGLDWMKRRKKKPAARIEA